MLTHSMKTALEFIVDYQAMNASISPTVREIRTALHIRSAGRAHAVLVELEKDGWIKRDKYRARGITVLRTPPWMGTICKECGQRRKVA
jgi:SOS-response transcriptional repressor LexA